MSTPFQRQTFDPLNIARIFSKTRSIPPTLSNVAGVVEAGLEFTGSNAWPVGNVLFALEVIVGTEAARELLIKNPKAVIDLTVKLLEDFLYHDNPHKSEKDIQLTLLVNNVEVVANHAAVPGASVDGVADLLIKSMALPVDVRLRLREILFDHKAIKSPICDIYYF